MANRNMGKSSVSLVTKSKLQLRKTLVQSDGDYKKNKCEKSVEVYLSTKYYALCTLCLLNSLFSGQSFKCKLSICYLKSEEGGSNAEAEDNGDEGRFK